MPKINNLGFEQLSENSQQFPNFQIIQYTIVKNIEAMDNNTQIDELFLQRLKSIRKLQLTNMLRCVICSGLFRFAHTIVDCGHTFCQIWFKGRNPVIKCPQCHQAVQSNYKRSIIRDVYKQTLVDSLAPEYAQQDKIIVKRVQQLFPEFDLQYIFDQFKSTTGIVEVPTKSNKKQSENANNPNTVTNKLPQKIKQKFNISYQLFCQMIVKEENFNNFMNIIKNGPQDPKIIDIKPKTARDETFIGINNQMKALNLNVLKLQRFIEKKALQKINKTQQVPQEWLNTQDDKLDIKIYLQINGKQIRSDDDLQAILRNNRGFPILYSLTK